MQFAPDDARPQRSLARALFKSGRVEEAIAIYHRVLERYPCDVLAYFGLGCVLQSVQRHDEAIGVFQDAIAHEPRAGAVHAYLADSLSAVGCASEAIASYRRALRHDPADLDTARKLLGLLRETWRHSESVEIYRILLRDKLDVEDLRDFGLLLLDLGESQEAERVLRQASQRAHDRADVRADVAMSIADQGRFAESIDALTTLLVQFPDHYYPRMTMGYVLLAADRPSEALDHVREAVRLNPEAVDTRALLGNTLLRTGDAIGALKEFEKGLSAVPGDLVLKAGRGAVFTVLRRHKEALDEFHAILAVDPDYLTRRPDNFYQAYYETSRSALTAHRA